MTYNRADRGAPTVLRIEGELTVFRAMELKSQLLGDPAPTEIDLSGVTEMDCAGLQLLLLAKKMADAALRDFRLVDHSPAVLEVFALLNVGAYFDHPIVMSARHASSTSGSTGRR